MADINLTLTIPDAYVTRLSSWIDDLHPKPEGITYKDHFKYILTKWIKEQIRSYEYRKNIESVQTPTDITIN